MIMRTVRLLRPVALGAALVAVAVAPQVLSNSPSGAGAMSHHPMAVAPPPDDPVAHASGDGGAPAELPSLVDVRVVRSEASLARATRHFDEGDQSGAGVQLSSAVLNMQKAWTGAVYVIETTPAPPPVADAGGIEAEASGAPVGGPIATAGPEDTAFAVLELQHDVMTTALGLIDGADPTLAPAITDTVSAAMDARDEAITYIHSIVPATPPPPVADAGGVRAHAGGAPVGGSTWDAVMPGLVPLLDDEIQHATATFTALPTSPVDLRLVIYRAAFTKNTVNDYWPPAPPAD
jgi:hypothetical protein